MINDFDRELFIVDGNYQLCIQMKYKEIEATIVNVHRIKSDSFDYFDDVEESLIDRKLVRKFSL